MMYLIYNNDGSIKLINLCEVINRGDNNTKQVFVAVENYENYIYSCVANFRLADGSLNQLNGISQTATINGEQYDGFVITLTSAQTLYPGKLDMAIKLLAVNGDTLFTYTTTFVINDTPYDPDETTISVAQYQALLQLIGQKTPIPNSLFTLNTRTGVNLSHFSEGQIFYVKDECKFYQLTNGVLVEYLLGNPEQTNFVEREEEPYEIPPEDQ